MKVHQVAMLAADSTRTRVYLEELERKRLLPSVLLFLNDPDIEGALSSANVTLISALLTRNSVPIVWLDTVDPNDDVVLESVQSRDENVFIYSGPSGTILHDQILGLGKQFLHVHPGRLPDFRGSTTIYYSLLVEGNCAASAFLLDAGIDTGPIVKIRQFPAPENRLSIDGEYDVGIRASLLAEVLEEYAVTGELNGKRQNPEEGETYHIIHPVLKHIAILGR